MVRRRMAERLVTGKRTRSTEGLPLFTKTRRKNGPRAYKPPPIAESTIHASIAEWLDWFLLPPALYTTFPAGWGKLPKAIAGRLYRCGMKAGMPDIFVFHGGHAYGIELKAEGRSLSSAQKTMHSALWAAGVSVYIARSIDDVYGILKNLKIPMRPWVTTWLHQNSREPLEKILDAPEPSRGMENPGDANDPGKPEAGRHSTGLP